jgi:hypothetical protein
MTFGCLHEHAKASTNRYLHVFQLSSIFSVFPTNLIVFGMRSNLSIHTLRTTQ